MGYDFGLIILFRGWIDYINTHALQTRLVALCLNSHATKNPVTECYPQWEQNPGFLIPVPTLSFLHLIRKKIIFGRKLHCINKAFCSKECKKARGSTMFFANSSQTSDSPRYNYLRTAFNNVQLSITGHSGCNCSAFQCGPQQQPLLCTKQGATSVWHFPYPALGFLTNSPQHKNGNVVNFVLAMPLERNQTNKVYMYIIEMFSYCIP